MMDVPARLRIVLLCIGLLSSRDRCASADQADTCTDSWGSKCHGLQDSCETDSWIHEKCAATCGACRLGAPTPRARPAPPPGAPPVFRVDVPDGHGDVLTFELFQHQQSDPHAAVKHFCEKHDFEPAKACIEGIMSFVPMQPRSAPPPSLHPEAGSGLIKSHTCWPQQPTCIPIPECWPPQHLTECAETSALVPCR